jgi:hypothetical protein
VGDVREPGDSRDQERHQRALHGQDLPRVAALRRAQRAVAQVAAVALLIDYVVTVAVQTAAGCAAIVSAFPALSRIPVIGPKILLVISVLAILVMCLGNLRGIREAGRIFALLTYLFAYSTYTPDPARSPSGRTPC